MLFGLILQAAAIMLVIIEVNSEMTADVVFSLLSDRLDNLAIETYNLKSELRVSVATINKRIDNIEKLSEAKFHQNTNNADVQRPGNTESDTKILKQTKENMYKALAMEKMFIRNVVNNYEEKFIKFQTSVSDQMDVMNTTVRTSSDRLERKLHEQAENANQLKKNFGQNITDHETMIAGVSNDHEMTISKLEGIVTEVSNIEDDLKSQDDRIRRVDSSVSELGSRLTGDLSSVQSRLSSIEERRVSFSFFESRLMGRRKEEVVVFLERDGHVNSYNYETGVFTTPETGMYLFHCSIQYDTNRKYIIALYIDGNKVGEVNDPSTPVIHTAYLSIGQEVYLTAKDVSSRYFIWWLHDLIIKFNGILIN